MRITLFAHGSRGDIWPMVALGWHLAQHRHEVTVAVPDEFRAFTEDVGLATAQLPFDGMAWLASEEGQRLLHTGGVEYARAVGREYDRRAEEFDDASLAAAEGADALVGSILTAMRTLVLGEFLRVPIAMVHQVPVAPSREYSSLLTRGRLRSGALRRASHRLTHLLWERGAADATRAFRRKLGLAEERMGIFRRLEEMRCLGLHTVSPSLFPRPSDWGEHLKITGAWQMPAAARGALEEGLPAGLEEWLDAGPPPVFLGFGSMPVLDPAPMFEDILAVTAALDRRAVLSANCLPPGAAMCSRSGCALSAPSITTCCLSVARRSCITAALAPRSRRCVRAARRWSARCSPTSRGGVSGCAASVWVSTSHSASSGGRGSRRGCGHCLPLLSPSGLGGWEQPSRPRATGCPRPHGYSKNISLTRYHHNRGDTARREEDSAPRRRQTSA